MNGSHLAMDGTPSEVFTHAEELVEMGLDIPELTRLAMLLKRNGVDLGSVYTMDQAVSAISALRGGADRA
jgi:energy-coupling factor transport system ATP-binding protein